MDVLQFLPEFKMVSCMNDSAWKVPGGLVPFGNILHFLHLESSNSYREV